MREGHRPLLSRRRFVTTAAAGAGAVSAVGLTAGFRPGAAGSGRGLSVADAVADAFKAHRLVALGAADSLQNHYDALMLLLADPRLPGLVDDIGGPARQVLAVEPAAHGPPVRIPAAGDTSADRHRTASGSSGASSGRYRCSFPTVAAALARRGSRTTRSWPSRQIAWSVPAERTQATGKHAQPGNCSTISRRTTASSTSTESGSRAPGMYTLLAPDRMHCWHQARKQSWRYLP